MKKIIIGFCSIVLVIIIIGVVVFIKLKSTPVAEIEVENIEISSLEDGNYEGEYEEGPVQANVTVQVKDHMLFDIVINEHRNGLGSKAESIVTDIIQKQSLEVDVISGATLSSYVIRKAVEIALTEN